MNQELNRFFASSEDPSKVSLRVQAIIVGASSLIIGVAANVFHLTLSAGDVVSLASGLGLIAGAVVFILGVSKAAIQKFGKAK